MNALHVRHATSSFLTVPLGGRAYGKKHKKESRKTILKILDLEQSKHALLNSLSLPSSRRFYDHAIRNTIEIVVLADVLVFFRH
jgi:hypothetical protein